MKNIEKSATLIADLQEAENILKSIGCKIITNLSSGGSSAQTFLIENNFEKRIVKIAFWSGIAGNGIPWLKSQFKKLNYYHFALPNKTSVFFPKVFDNPYISNSQCFLFSLEYLDSYEFLPFFYLHNDIMQGVELCQDINNIVSMLCLKLYSLNKKNIDKIKHFQKTQINRLDYRINLLINPDTGLNDRYISEFPVHFETCSFENLSFLFSQLFLEKNITINGRSFPNISTIQQFINVHMKELSVLLTSSTCPFFSHGDLLLRNIMKKGSEYKFIDLRGTNIHTYTPEDISIEYEMAKIYHSFFTELVRFGFFSLDLKKVNEQYHFKFAFANNNIVNTFLYGWNNFFPLLENNKHFINNLDKGLLWKKAILLITAIHFATDAINRVCQDRSGYQAIAYYLLSIILFDDFIQQWSVSPTSDEIKESISKLCFNMY